MGGCTEEGALRTLKCTFPIEGDSGRETPGPSECSFLDCCWFSVQSGRLCVSGMCLLTFAMTRFTRSMIAHRQ